MGYTDLNQRDSFWTSFAHLLYWPELERKMLRESAEAVAPSGKVPTCILKVYERNDDIDINEYFLLRIARYHRLYHDKHFLTELWPVAKRALRYLAGRCGDGHLPIQGSFWADWKDVKGIQERKYGPHFCLLWLAVLKEMQWLAEEMDDKQIAETCRSEYTVADKQVNRPVAEGGLWNGRYYVNVWKDGREDNHVLQDQMVAGIWQVIPPERMASIIEALKANEKPWGVRETFPYYPPETFGLADGDYHNGAVWPWLCFADAAARAIYGYEDDARRILYNVGYWDLEHFGDFLAHENLHGETGVNNRRYIQGWNAAFLCAVKYGLQRKI